MLLGLLSAVAIVTFLAFMPALKAQSNFVSFPQPTHSLTKAVCSQNYCQDYEIICNQKDIISMSAITGAVIQIPEDWKDPRSDEILNKFC